MTVTDCIPLYLGEIDLVLVFAQNLSKTFLERVLAIFISFLDWIQNIPCLIDLIIFLLLFE